MEVVPQVTAVKVPPHVPLLLAINSMAGFVKLIPILLRLIVGLVVCATNLYHTSYTGVTAQSPLIVTAVRVAPYMVPVVLLQAVADINVGAPAHKSFAGTGSSTQIVNAAEAPVE